MNLDFNENEFLKGRLLAKLPLYLDDKIPIYSPELVKVFDVGESNYYKLLNYCTISRTNITEEIAYDVTDFDILVNFMIYDEDKIKYVLDGFYFFTGINFEIKSISGNTVFVNSDTDAVIDGNNYSEFIRLVKIANLIKDEKDISKNPNFDKYIENAKKRLEERLRKKGVALAKNNENEISLLDLVSSLCSCHNSLNILNIWDLTLFQFQDQFQRTRLIEDFNIGIRSLLAGAKKEEVKLEHYIKKIH